MPPELRAVPSDPDASRDPEDLGRLVRASERAWAAAVRAIHASRDADRALKAASPLAHADVGRRRDRELGLGGDGGAEARDDDA